MAFAINHIYLPTDFSKNAERALPFAAEIASKTGAKLTLFHASSSTMDIAPSFEENKDELVREANEHFNRLIEELNQNSRYKKLNYTTILQSGQPVTSLLNQIAEDKPNLIVMGTKGATSNRNVVFGSVTTSIIEKAEVPVLAVPQGSTLDKFKKIIFTTDYKEGDLAALQQTLRFAELFHSDVHVLHVADQKNLESEIKFRGFRDLVTSQITYEKLHFQLLYENDFFPAIADYLAEHPTSLLVMVQYKKTFWKKLAERDHSKEMAFYTHIPLLMLVGHEDTLTPLIIEDRTGGRHATQD